jgi:acetyl-CoA synthetase
MEVVNPAVRAIQRRGIEEPDELWARAAAELPWFRRWDSVLEWTPPSFRWFNGATTNLAYNCLDRHVGGGRAGHAALIAYSERGDRQVLTYAQLLYQVERAAAALRGLGIGKGDRIAIYMPTCPEAIVLMLAAVRIGAVHLVVFAGFGSGALGDRIRLAGARALFCADVTWRKGREVDLEGIVEAAVDGDPGCPSVEQVVVLRRSGRQTQRDWLGWEEFLARADGHHGGHVELEANEPAYILATSGTTARPKLAVHTHGPHQVHIHAMGRWCFGMRPDEVWWSTSDIGWVVGHSYIVYAPLLFGCATIAYEGALDHPDAETVYRIVAENRVSGIFTSPTAVRLLMRYGAGPSRRHDLSSVERVFCAGEVLNPPAWEWFQKEVFDDRVPVLDHMWQTETSGPIVGNPYGIAMLPTKPGSSGVVLPGIDAAVLTPEGKPCQPGEKGIFVIRRPFPGLTATLWGEPERYGRDYWQRIPDQTVYFSGDAAAVDEDGYVWFSGRADEIIKIAGHRIGTIEVETAFLRHPAVAEAGVAGRADQLRGEVISAFVSLKEGHKPSSELRDELIGTVRRELGPVAVIGELSFVSVLPKTRSGKIMRRVLRAVATGGEPGDISTIEDEGSVTEAREAWQRMKEEVAAQRSDG